MRKLRLGVDMDGTIINNEPVWKGYFDMLRYDHGHRESVQTPFPTWEYIKELCSECSRTCFKSPDLLLETPLMPGAWESLRGLTKYADLYLVTHRSPALYATVEKLFKVHDILDCFQMLTVSFTPKLETCLDLQLDALVDDGPANIEALTGSPVTPIIMDWPYNRHLSGYRCHGWGEVARFVLLWRAQAYPNMPYLDGIHDELAAQRRRAS